MFKIADPNSTVLVELNTKGKARVVAFRPDEERALMVGSDVRADFRVSGTGVAPVAAVAFHLERRDGVAWLVPAYELDDLRLNTARVTGPLPLEERNVIEFGEVCIDATVLDGGLCSAGETPSGDDVWSQPVSRTSEPPGEDDTTLVAMRAIGRPTHVSQQTTAMLRPIDAAALVPQQTERMVPYRPQPNPAAAPALFPVQITERMPPVRSATASLPAHVTAFGTEIMAPYRPNPSEDPDAPPPTVRARKHVAATAAPAPDSVPRTRAAERAAPDRTAARLVTSPLGADAVVPPLASQRIVPVPVVAVTLAALAKPAGSSPSERASDDNTTLFEMPVVRREQRSGDGGGRDSASTPGAARSPTPSEWSNDKTRGAVAKTPAPGATMHFWLEKLGLLAKARPVLVAGGSVVGALVLAAALLGATRLARHHQAPRHTAQASRDDSSTPHRAVVGAAAPALPEPIQIVEVSAPPAASGAPRSASIPAVKSAPNDPELAAAVAHVIAGRYSDAREAYASLSQRTDSATTYAAITRLLARTESAECSGGSQDAPKDCPGVHR